MVASLGGCKLLGLAAHPRVQFGATGLPVSTLCQGTAFRSHQRTGDDPAGQEILRHAIDIGVNFFDSAEAYGWGGSETALGNAIKGKRDQVVIATKASPADGPNGPKGPFTRERLMAKVEGSLRRLGTDHLDIYLLHDEDGITSAEEIATSMDSLVKAGKTRYWGVSNHNPKLVADLIRISSAGGLAPIAALEDYYTISGKDRTVMMDNEMFPLIRQANLGLMAFSPLDGGNLAPGREGKAAGTPLEKVIDALDDVANALSVSRPQVCVAWSASRPEVTCVLSGAEKPEHVTDNLAGTQLVLPPEAMATLDTASAAYSKAMATRSA